jgi:hypothetical protein
VQLAAWSRLKAGPLANLKVAAAGQ